MAHGNDKNIMPPLRLSVGRYCPQLNYTLFPISRLPRDGRVPTEATCQAIENSPSIERFSLMLLPRLLVQAT